MDFTLIIKQENGLVKAFLDFFERILTCFAYGVTAKRTVS
jgi:hypothetical protein